MRFGGLGQDFGHMGASLGRAGTSVQRPNPPVLTLVSDSTDATPDFDIDLPNGWGDYRDAAAGDHLIIEYQLQSGGSISTYVDHVLTSGDITTDEITITGVSSVADGVYYFWSRIVRVAVSSVNSSNVSVTIAASAANYRIASTGNRRISSAGNNRKAS